MNNLVINHLCRLIGLFLLFSLCAQVLLAQGEDKQFIELKVVNEKGHKINDAYVINKTNGKLVDVIFQGKLSFKAKLPIQLRVFHIAYQNRSITIAQNDKKGKLFKKILN